MEELSIKGKAKRYDEAVGELRGMMPNWERLSYNGKTFLQDLTHIFPELAETEDEKIRESLLEYLHTLPNHYAHCGVCAPEWIAWIKKQGEQNLIMAKSPQLGEQKPADKAEPKFKVGDWISGYYTNYKVLSVNNNGYVVEDVDGNKINILFENEKFHRLWTIRDAKDGDVLCCERGWTCIFKALDNHTNTFSSYCFIDSDKWFCNTGSECHTLDKAFIKAYNGEIYPATKEQRDTLEKAMADAGYTFDFEKKELKKIEQKPWSEEDEHWRQKAIDFMKHPDLIKATPTLAKDTTDWLKSLRPQNTWKPSDEQIKAVRLARSFVTDDFDENPTLSDVLIELERQLKKLREE